MSTPKHSSYFDGNVQSLGFERNGRRSTVGVVSPGEYHFGTDGAERMTIISGELLARLPGGSDVGSSPEWRRYPAGTAFEVPAKSGFDVKAVEPAAYCCEFL